MLIVKCQLIQSLYSVDDYSTLWTECHSAVASWKPQAYTARSIDGNGVYEMTAFGRRYFKLGMCINVFCRITVAPLSAARNETFVPCSSSLGAKVGRITEYTRGKFHIHVSVLVLCVRRIRKASLEHAQSWWKHLVTSPSLPWIDVSPVLQPM